MKKLLVMGKIAVVQVNAARKPLDTDSSMAYYFIGRPAYLHFVTKSLTPPSLAVLHQSSFLAKILQISPFASLFSQKLAQIYSYFQNPILFGSFFLSIF